MPKTLFTRVRILDCSGDDPFDGELLVEGNRIAAIGRGEKSLARDGVDVVDGSNTATLMPGLIESHAHLSIKRIKQHVCYAPPAGDQRPQSPCL